MFLVQKLVLEEVYIYCHQQEKHVIYKVLFFSRQECTTLSFSKVIYFNISCIKGHPSKTINIHYHSNIFL
jgi:hypothetical protein